MKAQVSTFVSGALFGAGLLISGMTRPEKVLGFLDVFGRWDASLAFVMIGAILVHATLLRFVGKRAAPMFATAFQRSELTRIDTRLVLGAAIFGVGWGLAGYCPGPALVSLGALSQTAVAFFAAMIAGMLLYKKVPARGRPALAVDS